MIRILRFALAVNVLTIVRINRNARAGNSHSMVENVGRAMNLSDCSKRSKREFMSAIRVASVRAIA